MDRRPALGVFTESTASYVRRFGRPAIYAWYDALGTGLGPSPERLKIAKSLGSIPMITLEPWCYDSNGIPAQRPLRSIMQGKHDNELIKWAQVLSAYAKPIFIRFAHEMNGDWYPWAAGYGDNTERDFLDAYWRTHRMFRNINNLIWVWSPNVSYPGSVPLQSLYPGDSCVDYIGLDGYNWGVPWMSPQEIFQSSIMETREFTRKRIFVAETACTADNRKSEWILQLKDLNVSAVVWFDLNKERDWSIASSEACERAYKRLLRIPVNPRASDGGNA